MKPKVYVAMRFHLQHGLLEKEAVRVKVTTDMTFKLGLLILIDPSFTKLPPDTALEELNIAMADYELAQTEARHGC